MIRRLERLLIAGMIAAAVCPSTLRADEPRLMRFVQLSDIHMVLPEARDKVRDFSTRLLTHSGATLGGAAKFIHAELKPDFIVCTGDTPEHGGGDIGLRSMLAVREALEANDQPVLFVYGNHDVDEGNFRKALGPLNFQAHAGNLTLVGLQCGCYQRRLNARVQEVPRHVVYALDDLLATAPGSVIVMTHEDIFCRPDIADWARPGNYRLLMRVLARHGNVPLVLGGHVHEYFRAVVAGTTYVTAPGLVDNNDATIQLAHDMLVFDAYADRIECSAWGAASTADAAAGEYVKSDKVAFTVPLKKPLRMGKDWKAGLTPQPLPTPATRYDAEIERAMPGIAVLLDRGWRFQLDPNNRGIELGWQKTDFDDSAWPAAHSFTAYWTHPDANAFAWYRVRFDVPADLVTKEMELMLGRVYDADQTWLNGRQIGATGPMPPAKPDPKTRGLPRLYPVPPGTLHAGENVLSVRVFDASTRGGRRDLPYLQLKPVLPETLPVETGKPTNK